MTNLTAKQAENNYNKLIMINGVTTKEIQTRLGQAFSNEHTIKHEAENLDRLLERIIHDAEKARNSLHKNELTGLNTCGLFQGMIHDADAAVTTLRLATESRNLYCDLLK